MTFDLDPAALAAPPSMQLTAYRLVQEALTNTRKHASGASVRVPVGVAGGGLTVRVDDDGRPAPGAAATPRTFELITGPLPAGGAGERESHRRAVGAAVGGLEAEAGALARVDGGVQLALRALTWALFWVMVAFQALVTRWLPGQVHCAGVLSRRLSWSGDGR